MEEVLLRNNLSIYSMPPLGSYHHALMATFWSTISGQTNSSSTLGMAYVNGIRNSKIRKLYIKHGVKLSISNRNALVSWFESVSFIVVRK